MLPPFQAGTGNSTRGELFHTALGFSRPISFRFTPLRPGGAKCPCHHLGGKGIIFFFATLLFVH